MAKRPSPRPAIHVQLPMLDAAGAYTLAISLQTAYKHVAAIQELPSDIQHAAERVAKLAEILEQARVSRLGKVEDTSLQQRRQVHIAFVAAWACLQSWAELRMRLAGPDYEVSRALAQQMLDTTFADGVRFTQRKFATAWAESLARLMALESSVDAIVTDGGGDFLQAVRVAHNELGETVGTTAELRSPVIEVDLQAPRRALLNAIRHYVLCVTSYSMGDHTSNWTAQLLAPTTSA